MIPIKGVNEELLEQLIALAAQVEAAGLLIPPNVNAVIAKAHRFPPAEPPKYTVVLAIPKYMTDGEEQSWCATVNAQNPIEAVQHAQKQVAKELDRPNCVEDFLPISIFEGEHEDLIGKWADWQNTKQPEEWRESLGLKRVEVEGPRPPCPFCGATQNVSWWGDLHGRREYMCESCAKNKSRNQLTQ